MRAGAEVSKPPVLRARRIVAFGLAAVALAVAIGVGVNRLAAGSAVKFTSQVVSERNGMAGPASWAPGVRPAPPITTLRDQDGGLFSLASLHGRTVAMVFFDSFCKQECPLEGRALAAAERQLPAAERPVLVAVSVDPADTRTSVRRAIRSWGLAGLAPWYWLMGNDRRLAPVWRAYHIYVGPKVNGDIPHTEALYLVDKRGYERSAYLYPFMPGFVRHDLRQLAAGASHSTGASDST
jgi:cytochrome oxidase Cu insertion factor (SCO1/SenC/PrrC family)